MTLAAATSRVVEHIDRRMPGAFRLIDAVTQLPVVVPAQIEVREASLAGGGAPAHVPLSERSVQIRRSASGSYAISSAPFFDDYSTTFQDPSDPPETPPGTHLLLRIAIVDAGPWYLPQEFSLALPRALDHANAENVFEPVEAPLFRSPGAGVSDGWSVLRVSVEKSETGEPLPGVLVRVFKNPRAATDAPIGWGMSEWRGHLRGEALVAVADLPRFRPGNGENVFETTQEIQLEGTRAANFGILPNELPEVAPLVSGTAAGIIRQRSDSAIKPLLVAPALPLALRAGEEKSVRLTMS